MYWITLSSQFTSAQSNNNNNNNNKFNTKYSSPIRCDAIQLSDMQFITMQCQWLILPHNKHFVVQNIFQSKIWKHHPPSTNNYQLPVGLELSSFKRICPPKKWNAFWNRWYFITRPFCVLKSTTNQKQLSIENHKLNQLSQKKKSCLRMQRLINTVENTLIFLNQCFQPARRWTCNQKNAYISELFQNYSYKDSYYGQLMFWYSIRLEKKPVCSLSIYNFVHL